MSFNISAWSIRSPIPTIVLFLVLTLAGLVAYPFLGIDQNPNIDIPAVTVTIVQPGADPTELESQVTKPVEDAVASLGNIDEIISTVTDGSSLTTINFVLGTNSDRATNDVRNSISQIRQSLPQDINEPIVQRLDVATGGPVVTYAVASPNRSVAELSDLVDRTISRGLLAVQGVSQVKRIGGVDREVRVDLDPNRLQAEGLTINQVNDQIRAFNINLPGGRSNIGGSEQTIRTLGSAPSVAALQSYQITLPKGGFVPLSSLGTVSDGTAEPRQLARLNNNPVVAFSVLRSNGSVLVSVEEGVTKAIEDLQKTLPSDIRLQLINNVQANYIRESYSASIESVVLGAILAVVTIWLFLRDPRATLITAVALPLSLIPTFAVLKALDYTLNNMTLLALALVVGILVDDAIVEIENIERHMQMGKSPFRAALDASTEIGLAVVATTMSIVAVFGPVAFMTGVTGQYFRPFGIAVAAAVLFSLLVARMVTPLMAAYLLKSHSPSPPSPPNLGGTGSSLAPNAGGTGSPLAPNAGGTGTRGAEGSKSPPELGDLAARAPEVPSAKKRDKTGGAYSNGNGKGFESNGHGGGNLTQAPPVLANFTPTQEDRGGTTTQPERQRRDRLAEAYRPLLKWALRHRPIVLGLSVLFLIGSLALVPHLPFGLFGNSDLGLSTISLELPPGATLQDTDRAAQQLTTLLRRNPNVSAVQTDQAVNTATLYVVLKPRGERQISQLEFENQARPLFAQIPGVRLSFAGRGFGGAKELSIALKSEDTQALTRVANSLEQQMRGIPGLVEIASNASLLKPEIIVRPDPARAGDLSVSVQSIARTAYISTLGDSDANLAKFNLSDRQIPIRIQLAPQFRQNLDTIRNLQVASTSGTLVPLQAVAEIELGSGPSQIRRYNRSRQIAVEANLRGIALGEAIQQVNRLPAIRNLPAGVEQERVGSAKLQGQLFGNVGAALGAAVVFIYVVLVLLFGDFLHPISIMVALPFSLGGAFFALLATNKELGLYALIGIVLLLGLVSKNSILLVDYAILNQKEGKSTYQAVLDSGVARLRPILMTTIAMISGMLPIALGWGAGSELRSPMAIVVIGGLATSTLLTLVVVPAIFTYIDAIQERLSQTVGRRARERQAEVEQPEEALRR